MRIKETEILEWALEKFKELTHLNVNLLTTEERAVDGRIDAIIDIEGKTYNVEIKIALNTTLVNLLINQYEEMENRLILITKYVNPNMADLLKKNNIQFIDTAGNAFINQKQLHIYIIGQKILNELADKKQNKIFRPTGLKVVFTLLINPGLEKTTYREIAKKADVALGTVNWVMRDLKMRNYLIDIGDTGRKLIHKKELLDRWVTTYPDNFRKQMLLGKYRAPSKDWWEHIDFDGKGVFMGGELAAAQLTKYLKPQDHIIYIEGKYLNEFIQRHRLRPDPNGNIEILKKFWKKELKWDYDHMVPPILIYADLLNTGDPRNRETAKIIYDKEIHRYI